MTVGFMAKCSSRGRPKKRHANEAEAEAHRRKLVRMGVWRMNKSNTYLCNACGHWHAGSTGSANRGGAKGHRKNRKRGRSRRR
jgi:hypothetical protein